MTTTLFSADEKLGLLLFLLGEKAVKSGIEALPAERSGSVKKFIGELREDPPSPHEIDFVLNDFEKYFRFALNSLGVSEDGKSSKATAGSNTSSVPTIISFQSLNPGNNIAQDLARLDAWQVATALSSDKPKTIALVLSQLPADVAGRILECLPEQLRNASFVEFSGQPTVPDPILQMLLRTTFQKANQIRERRSEVDHTDKIVEMMRSLPKEVRKQLMAQLMESDEAFSTAVREKMYRFDDIMRLDDRNIQAVLAKVSSEQLVMGLTRADPKLSAKVLGNMSKRARATVEEEISFNEKVTDTEIELARNELAQVLGRMDEAGEISL
jgi:flagellar motor switch protein FliG